MWARRRRPSRRTSGSRWTPAWATMTGHAGGHNDHGMSAAAPRPAPHWVSESQSTESARRRPCRRAGTCRGGLTVRLISQVFARLTGMRTWMGTETAPREVRWESHSAGRRGAAARPGRPAAL